MGDVITIAGIELSQTCSACPEQYDAHHNGKKVGCLRLRHGHFTVNCPDASGELIHEASPEGDGQLDPDERDKFLRQAVNAIQKWVTEHPAIPQTIKPSE